MVLFAKVSFAQKNVIDTIWLNNEWKEIPKKHASYYRVLKKAKNGYIEYTKTIKGELCIIAELSAINPTILNGSFTHITGDGTTKGQFKNNKQAGRWVSYFKNRKDSSVSEYNDDGVMINYNNNPMKMSKVDSKKDVFTVVEVMPEYPNGKEEIFKFINDNIKYPQEAFDKKWEGKAFINFIVNENGNIVEPKVEKSSGYEVLDDEAIRVIKLMPKWKPGMQNNKNVQVQLLLPFNFTLNK